MPDWLRSAWDWCWCWYWHRADRFTKMTYSHPNVQMFCERCRKWR